MHVANARIAAIVLSLLSATLVGQTPPKIQVAFKVTVDTRAYVSGAVIHADPSTEGTSKIVRTDRGGEAVIKLPAGVHVFSISVPGFYPWTRTIDIQQGFDGAIEAALHAVPIIDGFPSLLRRKFRSKNRTSPTLFLSKARKILQDSKVVVCASGGGPVADAIQCLAPKSLEERTDCAGDEFNLCSLAKASSNPAQTGISHRP